MPNDADDNTRAPTSQMKLTRPLPAAGPSLESVSHCGRSERVRRTPPPSGGLALSYGCGRSLASL
jgi:hypothetical protein